MTPHVRLVHSALANPPGAAAPLAGARLTDRARLAVVLEGAAVLSLLESAGWRLRDAWRGARIGAAGRLRRVAVATGPADRRCDQALADLSARLFAGDPALRGRGEARAALRDLVWTWRADPVVTRPDRAVEQLLERAPFLWRDEFGRARRALAGGIVRAGRESLHVAGPSWFADSVRVRVSTPGRAADLLGSPRALGLWRRPPRGVSPGARRRLAVARAGRAIPRDETARLVLARRLCRGGEFERAITVLADAGTGAAGILRAQCLLGLDRPVAAWREVEGLGGADGLDRMALERVAVAVLTRRGRTAAAARRIERLASSAPGWLRPEIHLLAAETAVERGDADEARRHLRRSRVALEQPRFAWRWYRAAGAAALTRGRGATAAGFYERALAVRRRGLPVFEAARLWHGLARARRRSGALAAAERAATHASRLGTAAGRRRAGVGARFATLVGIRLRRGRPEGLEPAIVAAGERDTGVDATSLGARRDLVRGCPARALERLTREPSGLDGERAVLAARALGWMGRPGRARRALRAAGDAPGVWLEAEELPALWALAGERGRARAAPAGSATRLWRGVLTGERSRPAVWAPVDALDSYRVARLVYDIELLAPGFCPAGRVARAARRLAAAGADTMAARLEAADRSAWQAVVEFLGEDRVDASGLRRLLTAASVPQAKIWFERDGSRTVLVDGRGGGAEVEVRRHGGRFVLAAPEDHPRLGALLSLIADRWPPPAVRRRHPGGGIVGASPALAAALERAAALAPSTLPILVLGETGTGKELLSRRVHELSRRAAGPFLPVNCAAVARDLLLSDLFGHRRGSFTGAERDRAGVFESARGGTVFLDEIGDLPAAAQGALLRVLQEGEVRRIGDSSPRRVDARVVAATHRDLPALVRRGRFRRDLFFRLEAASIELPPLRLRGGDVVLLAEHFLRRLTPGGGAALSGAARARLEAHSWPGNVRELENALAVAVALSAGGTIDARHLDLRDGAGKTELGYHARVARYRRRLVEEALEASGGNRAAAARRIGLSRQAMSYLVRTLGVRRTADV